MTTLKEKSPESIVLRFVWLENLTQDYTNEEIGRIVRDLYGYARNGTIPSQYLDRGMRGLWRSMKDGVDKDFSKYREKSKKNSEAAKARWVKQMQKDDVPVVQTDTNAYIDIFADQLSAECRTYFEAVQTAKAEKKMNSNMTDEEFLKALREHPELIPQVMQILTQEKQEVHPAG